MTERGGPTSHTAIIARQLGIPCVVGVAGAMTVAAGTPLLVDGVAGDRRDRPGPDEAARRGSRADAAARAALASWTGPGATADGVPVKMLANVADGESARAAGAAPVQGVGLFRTELCFLNRQDEPSVEEQAEIYGEVLAAFGDRAVRRGPHPRRRLRQAGRLRHPRGRGEPRPRRPRAAAVLRQPRAAGPPARRDRGRRPRRPAPRPG